MTSPKKKMNQPTSKEWARPRTKKFQYVGGEEEQRGRKYYFRINEDDAPLLPNPLSALAGFCALRRTPNIVGNADFEQFLTAVVIKTMQIDRQFTPLFISSALSNPPRICRHLLMANPLKLFRQDMPFCSGYLIKQAIHQHQHQLIWIALAALASVAANR